MIYRDNEERLEQVIDHGNEIMSKRSNKKRHHLRNKHFVYPDKVGTRKCAYGYTLISANHVVDGYSMVAPVVFTWD